MKNKKFKLFASLTSLVMVVAVMAVGVWAATSATVGVAGTVSFTTTANVMAKAEITGLTITNGDPLTETEYSISNKAWNAVSFGGTETGAPYAHPTGLNVGDISGITIKDYNQAVVVTYTVKVTNQQPTNSANPVLSVAAAAVDGGVATPEVGTAKITAVDGTSIITVSYSFEPTKAAVGGDIGITITLTASAS